MPSIFTRHRASDSLPNAMPEQRRTSMDAVRGMFEEKKKTRRLSSASQIFDEGKGSLRQRLTSASQIFHKKPDSLPPGAAPRHDDPFTPNFSMSNPAPAWQPSYPTVIDDAPAQQGENERRRSLVAPAPRSMPTPSPDEAPRVVTPPSVPAPLPTPPPTEPVAVDSVVTDEPKDEVKKTRPNVPIRRTTLIQSPPMPQPIQNLPSMVGWPAFMKDGIPGTPGWGQLAREGGPKTPGWSGTRTPGFMSPRTSGAPGTPGASGFPFSLPPTTVGQNKGKGREMMSEEDLRKARRAMPVMLRQPTTLPEADGGEAGDSDDSDTEVEGHDSETETEPPRNDTSRFLKGKGKAISSLATTSVQEEPLRIDTKSKGRPFWALPTPISKPNSASWTSFGASTPAAETDGYFPSNPSSAVVTPGIGESPQRPMLQTRASRSMVDLTPSREPPTKIDIPKSPINLEWAKPPPTPAGGAASFLWTKKDNKQIGTVKRRRSADDLVSPPQYEPPLPGSSIPRPRDEEGKEKLPAYWCAVHIEGNLSRKMEFSAPGIQSRDRSWRKHYFIIHGTALSVYRFDPHRHPLKFEPSHPVPSVTETDSEEHLHVHVPTERRASVSERRASDARRPSADLTITRRGSVDANSESSRRTSVSSNSEKDASLFAPRRMSTSSTTHSVGTSSLASHFQQNSLVKQYSLQNAESGLAADYVKRKNVVRVRAEGEQFLLQTESAREVVDWIEAFQAATNVSLDLDDRPMPKIITLPRRRRRRVPGPAANAPGASGDTPEGNAAAVAEAQRAERERENMLAEDQATQAR